MNQGKLVFSQLMAFLPLSTFRRCVARHRGDHKVQNFTCMDQFLTMAFALKFDTKWCKALIRITRGLKIATTAGSVARVW